MGAPAALKNTTGLPDTNDRQSVHQFSGWLPSGGDRSYVEPMGPAFTQCRWYVHQYLHSTMPLVHAPVTCALESCRDSAAPATGTLPTLRAQPPRRARSTRGYRSCLRRDRSDALIKPEGPGDTKKKTTLQQYRVFPWLGPFPTHD